MLETAITTLNQHLFPLFFTPYSSSSASLYNCNSFTLKKCRQSSLFPSVSCSLYGKLLKVSAAKKQEQQPQWRSQEPGSEEKKLLQEKGSEAIDLGWLPAFPHVLVASMSNFLFGYHIGVMNGPIVSVARELGFEGNSFLEGLVVSMFIGGAFIGSISSGTVVDKLGCRRTLQADTMPLILGAIIRNLCPLVQLHD